MKQLQTILYKNFSRTIYLISCTTILPGFMIFSLSFPNQAFSATRTVRLLNRLSKVQSELLSDLESTNDKKRTEAAEQLQSMAELGVLNRETTTELKAIIDNTDTSLYARTKAVIIVHHINPHPIPPDLIHKMSEQITDNQHKLTILSLLDELLHQKLSSDSTYNIADKLMDTIERIIFNNPNESESVIRQATSTLAHIIVQFFHLNLEMATKDADINDVIDMLNSIKDDKKQAAQTRMAAEHMMQNIEKYRKKYNLTTDSKQCGKAFSQ